MYYWVHRELPKVPDPVVVKKWDKIAIVVK